MRISQTDGFFSSPEKRNLVLGLLLIVATLALYNPVSHHPFVNFDDDRYVTDNVHVRAGLQWQTVKWAFTTFDEANWHPLTWLSHALDRQLFGENAAGHHYTNVLLHALNAVLVFWVLWQATSLIGRSWMVAALFALHPINVESVAWVAERKNVLSMLFFLLALGAYGWYARRPALGRYLAVAGLFACGLMAKPMVITLPLVLLLWDYWPLQRMRSGFLTLALEKVPLLTLSAVSAIITLKAQKAGDAVGSLIEYPLPVRLGNAFISYVRYLGKAVWPSHLSPVYPYPEGALKTWQVVAAGLLLIAVTALVVRAKQRYLAVGWFWFLGTLVPMIGIVQVGSQAMADRYAYLPFLGLFIMVCWGLADWVEQKRHAIVVLITAGAAAILLLGVVTHRQIGYWSSNLALWSHAVQVAPGSFVAEDNLGGALLGEGRQEDAIAHFRTAATIHPQDPMSHLNLAAYAQRQGNTSQAVEQYQQVVHMTADPRYRATAFSDLGYAYRELGDSAQARASFQAAVGLRPRNLRAWLGLGLVEQKAGNYAEAVNAYSRALAIQPWDLGYFLLARALQQNGRPQEAQTAMQEARRLSENFDELHKAADSLLAR